MAEGTESELPVQEDDKKAGSDGGVLGVVMGVRVPQRQGRRISRTQRPRKSTVNEPGLIQEPDEPPAPSFSTLAQTVANKSQDTGSGDPSLRVQFLLDDALDNQGQDEDQLNQLFCQMNEFDATQSEPVWRETARWIKFEEDVEEGGERWSKPRVATLSLLSLFELRNCLCSGEVLLECNAQTIGEISDAFLDRLILKSKLQPELREQLKEIMMMRHLNLHERRLARNSSFLGSKIRSFAEFGRKQSAKDLENEAKMQKRGNNTSSAGLLDVSNKSDTQPATPKYDTSFMRKVPQGAETANILVGCCDKLSTTVSALIRLQSQAMLHEVTEVPVPSRFVFVLLGPEEMCDSFREIGRCMGTIMCDEVFRDVAYLAKSKEDLLAGIDEFLKFCIVLPPNEWDPTIRIEPPNEVPSQESRKLPSSPSFSAIAEKPQSAAPPAPMAPAVAPAPDAEEESHIDESLERTGRLFGGLIGDIKRKVPFFVSDFKDALHVQTVGAFFFLYFACLTPMITFGGLLTDATEGNLGAMESILSGAICGITFSLFAGQPLTILGSTGPVLIFETIVYKMCKDWQWDYLGFRFWIGMWILAIMLLIVAFDLSALIKYITRFTEESFAFLIALIFMVEAIRKQISIINDYPINPKWFPGLTPELDCQCQLGKEFNESDRKPLPAGKQYQVPSFQRRYGPNGSLSGFFLNKSGLPYWDWDSAANQKICVAYQGEWVGSGCGTFAVPDVFLFSCLLFIGTFSIGYGLKAMRNSRYFPNRARALISDFAIMIAIVSMTAVDLLVGLHTPKLQVPSKFSPTLGYDTRGWLVSPFGKRGENPWYSTLFALLPALLGTILVFLDQQITAVIVNRKENKLRKSHGYHLDLLIVGLLIGLNSVLGIPWFIAATVLSINHVMALKIESESSAPGERPKFLGIRENRFTGTVIFLMIGLSVFLTPVLRYIPMPVLYGVFLYMGFSSLRGIQIVQRVALFLMPQKYQPDYNFLRHVKMGQVHKFTIIQVVCLALLWAVKSIKQVSILFPIMVLAMCFVRKALDCVFSQQELKWLDNVMPKFTLRPAAGANRSSTLKQQQESSDRPEAEALLTQAPQIVVESPGATKLTKL